MMNERFSKMKKKGALFYIIDALVASAIIVVTIIIIFGTKVDVDDSTVAEEAIGNYITILSNKEIKSLISLPVTNRLVLERKITNPRSTIFEAVVELVENGYSSDATELMREVSNIVLEPQFSINVSLIEGNIRTPIYEKKIREESKAKIDLNRQQAISFKADKYVQKTIESISVGETGTSVCSPANCLFITDSNSDYYTAEFNLKGCSLSGQSGWFAHCRYETSTELVGPVIVEVRLWV